MSSWHNWKTLWWQMIGWSGFFVSLMIDNWTNHGFNCAEKDSCLLFAEISWTVCVYGPWFNDLDFWPISSKGESSGDTLPHYISLPSKVKVTPQNLILHKTTLHLMTWSVWWWKALLETTANWWSRVLGQRGFDHVHSVVWCTWAPCDSGPTVHTSQALHVRLMMCQGMSIAVIITHKTVVWRRKTFTVFVNWSNYGSIFWYKA